MKIIKTDTWQLWCFRMFASRVKKKCLKRNTVLRFKIQFIFKSVKPFISYFYAVISDLKLMCDVLHKCWQKHCHCFKHLFTKQMIKPPPTHLSWWHIQQNFPWENIITTHLLTLLFITEFNESMVTKLIVVKHNKYQ